MSQSTSSNIAKTSTSDSNEHNAYKSGKDGKGGRNEKDADRILHHKCPVIKLVKAQMINMNNVFTEEIEQLKRALFWKKVYICLGSLLFLIVFWAILVYGALIGAEMCGIKKFDNSNCHCGVTSAARLSNAQQTISVF